MAGSNKLFVMIAIFLVGMLVLGLLAIGGVVIFGSINRAQQATRPTATSTLAVLRAATPTQTRTPTTTPLPTNTPPPTMTYTPVVQATVIPASGAQGVGEISGQGEIVPPVTPSRQTLAPSESTPNTGIGGLEAVLIAAGLVGVLFVARRLRADT